MAFSLREISEAARDWRHGWALAAEAALALLICRAASAFMHPQFWAEEAAVFLKAL